MLQSLHDDLKHVFFVDEIGASCIVTTINPTITSSGEAYNSIKSHSICKCVNVAGINMYIINLKDKLIH